MMIRGFDSHTTLNVFILDAVSGRDYYNDDYDHPDDDGDVNHTEKAPAL